MIITYEDAERAATYYCSVRDLEEELEAELRDRGEDEAYYLEHPEWDAKSEALNAQWNLSEQEQKVLSYALEEGLCDYFGPEDILGWRGEHQPWSIEV